MKLKLLIPFLCVSISLLLPGCKHRIQATNLTKGIDAPKHTREASISETDTIASMDFSVRLFQKVEKKGVNTLLSPLSILPSLAAVTNGANGETLAQMEHLIGMPIDVLNRSIYSYTNQLVDDRDNTIHLANSLWLNQTSGFDVKQDFLKSIATWYHVDVFQSQFNDQTVEDINSWVSQHTNEMIPSILNQVQKEDVLYMINALSFDSKWANTYETSSVSSDLFTHADGSREEAQFMHSQEYEYIETPLATGFLKPYAGYTYAFAAVLPREDISLSQLVSTLNGTELHHMLTSTTDCPVIASIPKFQADFETDLTEVLQEIGMRNAFQQDSADFSKIGTCSSSEKQLYINRILHKSNLSVAEKGTKAGSATSIEMKATASPQQRETVKEVQLNRPFLYMIIDYQNRFPIFLGTIYHIP